MLIPRRRGWEIPESRVTPERFVLSRRSLTKGALGLATAAAAIRLMPAQAAPNPKYPAGRDITPETDSTSYNNFYEFGDDKSISRAAQRLPITPWQIEFAGMVAKPQTIGFDDLLKQVQLEQRVYRHRCVETWLCIVAVAESGAAGRLREVCRVRVGEPAAGDARAAQQPLSLALCRRLHDAGSGQRCRIYCHRYVWS